MGPGKHSTKLLFPVRDRAAGEVKATDALNGHSISSKIGDLFDLKKLQTDGGDITRSAKRRAVPQTPCGGSHVSGVCDQGICLARHSLVYEVFVSSRGHEAEGGAGCPTELALSSNCWQGLWRVLEKSVDPVRVCVGNE